jgi:hypothetical protein
MRRQLITGATAALAMGEVVALPAAAQSPGPQPAAGNQAQKDTTPREVSISFSSTQLESRLLREGVDFGFAANQNLRIKAQLAMGGRTLRAGEVVASGESQLTGGPGKKLAQLTLTDRGRDLIRRDGTELMVLHVEPTDDGGNEAQIADRLSRTQRLDARRSG